VDGRDKPGHDVNRFAEEEMLSNQAAMKTVFEKNGELLRLMLPQEALSDLGWTSGDILDLNVEANCLRSIRSMKKHEDGDGATRV
jgi:hypothetical protein